MQNHLDFNINMFVFSNNNLPWNIFHHTIIHYNYMVLNTFTETKKHIIDTLIIIVLWE